MMTPLEILEVIFKLLTLLGLIGILAGVVRRDRRDGSLLYAALGFTAVSGALWIVVSFLKQ
jgi:hypothetical protein